jgi:hypothetical protein
VGESADLCDGAADGADGADGAADEADEMGSEGVGKTDATATLGWRAGAEDECKDEDEDEDEGEGEGEGEDFDDEKKDEGHEKDSEKDECDAIVVSTGEPAPPVRSRLIKGASTECDRRRLGTRLARIPPRRRRATRDPESAPIASPSREPTEPPWTSYAEARTTVGRRVRLYWGGDHKWYAGRIVLVHPTSRQVFIKYDDHDERWHAMWEERWEYVDV